MQNRPAVLPFSKTKNLVQKALLTGQTAGHNAKWSPKKVVCY